MTYETRLADAMDAAEYEAKVSGVWPTADEIAVEIMEHCDDEGVDCPSVDRVILDVTSEFNCRTASI